jgi:hypothetical protein
MNTITDDELLDMAEPLRPLLRTSADWRAVRMYARAVLALAEQKQDAKRGIDREAAACKRAPPPRTLPKRGSGALHGEQQFCFELGWKEGVAALRRAIRERP